MRAVVVIACVAMLVSLSQAYNLVFLDANTLLNNRKLAKNGFYKGYYYVNEDLSLAVKRFTTVAGTALDTPRAHVMMKTQIPPSGNKHDYFSQAVFYWPNNYTRGGWPFQRRAGQVNPQSRLIPDQKNYRTMYNKFCQLTLMYFYSGERKYAQGAIEFIRTWFLNPDTRMNPHMQYASVIPGFLGVRGEGIIEIHTIVYLLDYLELVKPSGLWTDTHDVAFKTWLAQYFNWLQTSIDGRMEANRPNAHGTYCTLQLLGISTYLNNYNYGGSIVTSIQNLLDAQMAPDQSFPRATADAKSFEASVFNLQGFFSLASLAEQYGFDMWQYNANGNSLEGGLDFLIDNYKKWTEIYPDADGPVIGRTDGLLRLIVKGRQVYGKKYDDIYSELSVGLDFVKFASQPVLQYYLTQYKFELSPVEGYFFLGMYIYIFLMVCSVAFYFFLYKIWYKTADAIEEERVQEVEAAKAKAEAAQLEEKLKSNAVDTPPQEKGTGATSTVGSKPVSPVKSSVSKRSTPRSTAGASH